VELPENIEYLTSSSNRVAVLRAVVDEPGKPGELRDRLGIPRSTFQRILSELQERNWAEKHGRVYSATPLGVYVEGHYSDCIETMSTLKDLSELFEYVPFSEVGVGFETLVGSEVTVSNPYSPHAPMERTLEILAETDEVHAMSPMITETHSEAFHEAILDDGTYVENILNTKVADVILERYGDRYEDVRDTGRTDTYVYDGELPFGLSIMDDTVLVSAYDEDGLPRAVLENDSEGMREWAESYRERYKSDSVPIEEYAGMAQTAD